MGCFDNRFVRILRESRRKRSKDVELMTQMPIIVAAAQYSLIYMLLGGGFFGAIVIYIVAKMLGK